MSISYGGDNIQDTDGGVLRPISSVMRNRIINGAMVIDQRNAGASVSVQTSTTYTLDRWGVEASANSKFTVQQSTTAPTGFVNSLLVTSSAATTVGSSDYYSLRYRIEGYNVSDLGFGTASASTTTLSFWVRSSLTGTFGGAYTNQAGNRSYPFTYTINSANTWEQKTVTIAGDTTGTWITNNGTGLAVYFGLGMGSTYSGTAGAWAGAGYNSATGATSVVGTSGATFYITGVQLEVGSSATGFEYRQYGTELQLCQRYYESSGTTAFGNSALFSGYVVNGVDYRSRAFFQVTKRAAPTVTTINEFAIAFPSTAGAADGIGDKGFGETRTANANSNSGLFSTYWTASAEL